jgi:hypothetical protein
MILPNIITANYIMTNTESATAVFGSQANMTKKFSDVFCFAADMDGNTTCMHSVDNCSFTGYPKNQYFKVFQEKLDVCGIGFTYESNLFSCISPTEILFE